MVSSKKPQRQYLWSHGLKEVRNYAERWVEEEQLEKSVSVPINFQEKHRDWTVVTEGARGRVIGSVV